MALTIGFPSFNPTSGRPYRALQAWQVLISCAANRQTITYDQLGQIMFEKKAAGVLAQTLDIVAMYCKDHKLPPLTALVVQTGRGKPGAGIPVDDKSTMDALREQVFDAAWFTVLPPMPTRTAGE